MAVSVPGNAKFGFQVALGVLAAMLVWHLLGNKIPLLAS